MKHLIFFTNELGQKRTGIEKTVIYIYKEYFNNIYTNSYLIDCNNYSLKNNLLNLYEKI